MDGAHYRLGIDHGLVSNHLGNAKIRNLGIHVFIQQDILGLNIAVNNPVAVGMLQCICQAHADFQHCVQAQLVLLHVLLQGNAVHIFHDDILIAALADNIVNIDNIRMHQPGRRLGLPLELLQKLLVAEELVPQHFDGHITVQKLIMGQKDLGHAAVAHGTDDFVASVQYGIALFIHASLPPLLRLFQPCR